jgi:hypothetical protein
MEPLIFHVDKITKNKPVEWLINGGSQWSRSIRLTLEDGTEQEIVLFSKTRKQILIKNLK